MSDQKKTLLLHHFESYWEDKLNLVNTSIYIETDKVLSYLKSTKLINHVIITKYTNINFDIEYMDIYEHCIKHKIKFEIKKYKYGWTKDDSFHEEHLNDKWCYGRRMYHDELDVLPIMKWMKNLKDKEILIGGFFEYECINDIQTILDALKIKNKLIKKIVVT
jgi:hypothetical protein